MSGKKSVKPYEQLTFTDDFMFCRILQSNPDLCKEMTELILGKKIGGIVRIESQQAIEITADGRGVRFDVYMQDERETIYDIEMQASRFREIPKRSRYYQGMIDLNILERGAKYTELKNCYIIFICMENPFPEAGLHKYTFVTSCIEKPGLEMQDGSVRVILSAEGTEVDVSGEMQGFLSFLKDQICRTDLTRRLSAEVEKARAHERWRVEYMTLLERDERMREEGREEGRKEGREEGEIIGTVKTLLEFALSRQEIEDRIVREYGIAGEEAARYIQLAGEKKGLQTS